MIRNTLAVLCCITASVVWSQEQPADTLKPKALDEIIVIGKKTAVYKKQSKNLGSLEQFLEKSPQIGMIKRGNYAWEPLMHSMTTERTLITIDGMHIMGACTDKMDPITSYVEITNLAEASLQSGQQGAQYGSTIGGAINLSTHQPSPQHGWQSALNTAYETNNQQKILGAQTSYTDSLYFLSANVMHRDAENYIAGGNEEIPFSQYRKWNMAATAGYRFAPRHSLTASVIYDKATNVGYPALPMDVSLAEALITSLQHHYQFKESIFKTLESKIYYNTITHRMDDTKRPAVPIHMDMPGWSTTWGAYSKLNATLKHHHLTAQWNGYRNLSVAEMTMYPSNPTENLMFMYTWPEVSTLYHNLYLEDSWVLDCHQTLKVSGALGLHRNEVNSTLGLESLQIFYPAMAASNNRWLKSVATSYTHHKNSWQYQWSVGYGERASSVSEGYGFYLYNSFDGYDYIGNPGLKNEKSFDISGSIQWKNEGITSRLGVHYFHITDYIVGVPEPGVLPMTIGAHGIKRYTALSYAQLWDAYYAIEYPLTRYIKWKGAVQYHFGEDHQGESLPFMSPLRYNSSFALQYHPWSAELAITGNATQTAYSAPYGESRTPDFAVINASAGYVWHWGKQSVTLKAGIENALDTRYTTYADWNKYPQQGRNIYINLIVWQ